MRRKVRKINRIFVDIKRSMTILGVPVMRLCISNCSDAYVVIDTGSNSNVLTRDFFNNINNTFDIHLENENKTSYTASGTSKNDVCLLEVKTHGFKSMERFDISDDIYQATNVMSEVFDKSIVGIIGSNFLDKHGWVIDFKCGNIKII